MLQAIRELPIGLRYNCDYFPVVVLSFFSFFVIYRFVSPYLSRKYSKSYPKLAYNNKVEWNVRLTSSIFATIVSTICLYILLVDHGLAQSPLIYDSSLVKTNIAIVMGYILSDMIIIILNYKIIGDAFTLFHHFFTIFGYSHALTYSIMPYFANLRLIVELSTPLVNMRWFLYAAGYQKDSIYFFLNGITMTLMFFTVRIASIPVYWYKVYTILDSPLWVKMRNFRYIMIITCTILDIINIYWFRKMFKGVLIVWSTNWEYYEKHHKQQQLQMLSSYHKQLMNKLALANNFYQSKLSGLHIINPGRYIGSNFIIRNINLPSINVDIMDNLNRKYDDVVNRFRPNPIIEHDHEDRVNINRLNKVASKL